MQDTGHKLLQNLEHVEKSLRRWHTRLTRATNAIHKLERKRRRLWGEAGMQMKPKTLADRPRGHTRPGSQHLMVTKAGTPSEIPLPELDAFFLPEPKVITKGNEVTVILPTPPKEADDLGIPAIFKRTEPVSVEALTEKRKKAEVAERSKMPLSDRESAALLKRLAKKDAKRRGPSRDDRKVV